MKITDLFTDFQYLGTHPFPAHLCTVPNVREPDVRDSSDDDYHVVFTVDDRFVCSGRLRKMKPYTALDEVRHFGWVDQDENFVAHGENPVNDDHEKVVAWRPCSRDFDLRT